MKILNNSEIIDLILTNSKRFEAETDSEIINFIFNSCSLDKSAFEIVRLRRKSDVKSEFKTLVVSVMDSTEALGKTLNAIASIKDLLVDPESSDLYFFGAFTNQEISKDEILKYESSDLFCRKYILRPNEDLYDFLQRTFLSDLKAEKSDESISDPLTVALRNTSENHEWLEESNQKTWRDAFLSGKNGSELIDLIFNDNA